MNKVSFFRSIRFQIPVILCIAILIPMLILYQINYSVINRITLENAEASIQSDLSGKALSIDYVLKEVTQFAKIQGSDTRLTGLIREYCSKSGQEKSIVRSLLTIELNQRIINNAAIDAVYLAIRGEDTVVSTLVGEKELSVSSGRGRDIYEDYLRHPETLTWSSGIEGKMLFYRSLSVAGLPECSLIFEANTAHLLKTVESKAYEHAGILICDYRGNVMLMHGPQQLLSEGAAPEGNISEDGRYKRVFTARKKDGSYTTDGGLLVEYYSSTSTSWKYIETVRLNDIYATADVSSNYLVLSLILGILVSVLGAFVISRIILRPMNRVLSAMKKTQKGDFTELAENNMPLNELGVLVRGYNSMTRHLQELIEKVYVQELSKKEAQLKSIQSQLDEHFLYNTLNTIYCVIERGDTTLASEMLVMLSRFFRLNLSEGRQYLKISEITELIKCYLWIQKMRYGDRLSVSVNVDEELLDCYAVKYLFQPIVENAVIHGLESRRGEGEIRISFKKKEDMLYFETVDNGMGMSEDALERLRRIIKDYSRAQGESFALKNINEQMRLAYGSTYQLYIDSRQGEGTRVSFTIPLKREDPNET